MRERIFQIIEVGEENDKLSLESYSSDFNEADMELDTNYHAVEIYLNY